MSNTRKLLRGRDWEPLSREIDRACDGIPPDRLRAEMYRGHPGLADQADAAFAETAGVSRRFTASMRDHGVNSVGVAPADVPGDIAHQVRGLYLRVAAELASGQRRHCPHVTPSAPVPALAPVFDDWAACLARCARYLRRPPLTEREEHTCDLCGRYRPHQRMGHLCPPVGAFILVIGVCPRCSARLAGASS